MPGWLARLPGTEPGGRHHQPDPPPPPPPPPDDPLSDELLLDELLFDPLLPEEDSGASAAEAIVELSEDPTLDVKLPGSRHGSLLPLYQPRPCAASGSAAAAVRIPEKRFAQLFSTPSAIA